MGKWDHLIPTGTNVGTGSGELLDMYEVMQTGQTVTGYELLEMALPSSIGKFPVTEWLSGLYGNLKSGMLVLVEEPSPKNQFGKFRFDPKHPYTIRDLKAEGRM
ncbi:hypothetical protein N431DRAFT_510236 [Stipitochalara longipes BDJ]|nr:hypothetical protein N431DRAFT_510236 [Stipitochalara longipes BDJ]